MCPTAVRSARVTYANGDTFEGEYNGHGQRHGHGLYRYTLEEGGSGEYEGEWQQGMKHGQGVMRYPNGDVYRGSWFRDQRHGQGTYKFLSGDVYRCVGVEQGGAARPGAATHARVRAAGAG